MHHTWIEKWKKEVTKNVGKIETKLFYCSSRVLQTLASQWVAVKIAIFVKYLKAGNNETRLPNLLCFASALNSLQGRKNILYRERLEI